MLVLLPEPLPPRSAHISPLYNLRSRPHSTSGEFLSYLNRQFFISTAVSPCLCSAFCVMSTCFRIREAINALPFPTVSGAPPSPPSAENILTAAGMESKTALFFICIAAFWGTS